MLRAEDFKFSRRPWTTPGQGENAQAPITRFLLGMKPGESLMCRRPKYNRLRGCAQRRSIPHRGEKLSGGFYRFTRL